MTNRVLHIVSSLEYRGATTRLRQLAQGLVERDWDLCVLNLGDDGPVAAELSAAGIVTIHPAAARRHAATQLLELPRLVRSFAPHLIHCWSGTACLAGRIAAGLARRPRMIAEYDPAPAEASVWGPRVIRHLQRSLSAFVVEPGAPWAAANPWLPPADRTHVIQPAVEPGNRSRAELKAELCQRLGLPGDTILIATVGPLTAHKRVKDLIWATDLLKAVQERLVLLVLGDGPHRWRLERFRDQVRIRDRVRFLGIQRSTTEILRGCDCLWHATAHRNHYAQSILEAMANGTPVVVSDVEAHRRLIVSDETGWLVRPGDRAGYARKTMQLLANPEQTRRVAQQAQQLAVREFPLQRMIDAYLQLYQSLPCSAITAN